MNLYHVTTKSSRQFHVVADTMGEIEEHYRDRQISLITIEEIECNIDIIQPKHD